MSTHGGDSFPGPNTLFGRVHRVSRSFVPSSRWFRSFVPSFRSLVPSSRSLVPYLQIHHTIIIDIDYESPKNPVDTPMKEDYVAPSIYNKDNPWNDGAVSPISPMVGLTQLTWPKEKEDHDGIPEPKLIYYSKEDPRLEVHIF